MWKNLCIQHMSKVCWSLIENTSKMLNLFKIKEYVDNC